MPSGGRRWRRGASSTSGADDDVVLLRTGFLKHIQVLSPALTACVSGKQLSCLACL